MLNQRLQSYLFRAGVVLLSLATLMLAAELLGLLSLPQIIPGSETPLHSIARIAVIGCVLAAAGSWE